eukprot:TRINITY_DN45362_c0_g1_i1.p1 TRINITY_DN45362_c0_g1~~TRINITY_DN45362_c0_g1_i1.p1  ORF type:complete len:626 (+),score=80.42 TRINITY_DN45362_c0_g1_i1:36-1880(+)
MRQHIVRLTKYGVPSALGFALYDACNKEWSVYHTTSTALKQYALYGVLRLAGAWQLRQLIADAEHGEEVQRRLLGELLQRHQGTLYGRQEGLIGACSLDIFRRTHPITRHEHYLQYIDRIRNGEENVMAPGRPDMLAMTSGTSGSPKLVPHPSEVSKTFFQRGVLTAFGVLNEQFPGSVHELQRSAKLTFNALHRELEGDIHVGSNSASPQSRGFQSMLFAYTSPLAAYNLSTEPDALYAHALCALKDKHLGIIEANFAPLVCMLLDTAMENRRHLVQDLRNGHIWDRRLPEQVPNAELRDAIDATLGGPDGPRAQEVDSLLRRRATASELWPHLRVVMTIDSGSFQPSAARLRELLGDVPIYSPFYAATEGLLGVNIFPQRPFGASTYLLDPGSMFFELLPLRYRAVESPPCDAPIPAWEGKVGEAYEIIVTTRGGLCRYRLGDVVKVVAMFGQMPIVSVEERSLDFLPSLHGERVAGSVFANALASTPLARSIKGAVVVDEPCKLSGARYHVFVEPAVAEAREASAAQSSLDEQRLDEALCQAHEVYASFRSKGAIQPLQLHYVEPGTFAALRLMLAKQTPAEDFPPVAGAQVKVPSVLRGDLAGFLMSAER